MRKLPRTLDPFLFLSLLGGIAYFAMAMIFLPWAPTAGGACSKEDIAGCTCCIGHVAGLALRGLGGAAG